MKAKIFWIVILSCALTAIYFIGYNKGYNKANKERFAFSGPIQKVETEIKVEPVVFTQIKEKEVYIRDSIFIPIKETDTVYVSVPREHKVYQDSLYRAVVSGYMPSLDSLTINQRTITNTITLRPKPYRWSVGVHAGYGVSAQNGTLMLAPHIGVGVSYNFIRF